MRTHDGFRVAPDRMSGGLLFILMVACAGCATIDHGSMQSVSVVSSPAGARVAVDSQHAGVTPLLVKVSRRGHHVVSITHDTFPPVTVQLTRHLSPVVYTNLLVYGVPALVDFANGAAWEQSPATVSGVFNVTGPPRTDMASAWGLARTDRVLFSMIGGDGAVIDGIVDSAVTDLLYLHPLGNGDRMAPGTPRAVKLRDVRSIAVHAPPDRTGGGRAGLHYSALATSPLALIPYGALLTMAAMPVGYFIGYTGAPPRWSPLEAYRSRLPLFLGDRVRTTLRDGQRRAGRVVDMDSVSLLLAGKPDTFRVARHGTQMLQRASGYNFWRGALYGVAGGATLGTLLCYSAYCGTLKGGEVLLVPFAFGTIGGAISPAFAPRRWVTLLW